MFKKAFANMFAKLSSVANGVVDCIGDALGLKMHDQWQNLFDGEDTVLHCQYYYPEKPLGGDRMTSHADASVVTLLNQLPAESGFHLRRPLVTRGHLPVAPDGRHSPSASW